MKEIIIKGLINQISFFGKMVKEVIQDDLNVIMQDFELEDGEAHLVEDEKSISLMITLKKEG